MRPSTFICTFFFVAAIWAAPVPVGEQYKLDVYPHGAIVGARAKHLSGEKDKKAAKDVSIHPAVVVAGPDDNNVYKVATMSKNLPNGPPEKDIKEIDKNTDLYGKVQLGGSRTVQHAHLRLWKNPNTGNPYEALSSEALTTLRAAMAPHADWKPPTVSASSDASSSRSSLPHKDSHPGPSSSNAHTHGPATPNRKNTNPASRKGKAPARPWRKDTGLAASGSQPSSNQKAPGPLNQKSAPRRPQVQKATKSRMVKVKKPTSKPVAKGVKPVSKSASQPRKSTVAKPGAKPGAKRVVKPTISRPAIKPKAVKVAPRKATRPVVPKPMPMHKAAPQHPAAPASRGPAAAKPAPKVAPRAGSPKRK